MAGAAEDWSRRLAEIRMVKMAVSLAFPLNPIAFIGGQNDPKPALSKASPGRESPETVAQVLLTHTTKGAGGVTDAEKALIEERFWGLEANPHSSIPGKKPRSGSWLRSREGRGRSLQRARRFVASFFHKRSSALN